eukprot:c25383_g1_i1 orf=306-1370(+)
MLQGKRLQSKVISSGVPVDSDGSPKSVKREGKPATERPPIQDPDAALNLVSEDKVRRRRLQDPLPLEASSEGAHGSTAQQPVAVTEPQSQNAAIASDPPYINPTYVPRSGFYFQHDDRTAPPLGRNNKRKAYDRSGWNDFRAKTRSGDWSWDTGSQARRRDEKNPGGSQDIRQINADGVWRHDRYFEAQAEELEDQKRPITGEKGTNTEVRGYDGKPSDGIERKVDNKAKFSDKDGRTDDNKITAGENLEKRYPDEYVGRRERQDYRDRRVEIERGRWMDADQQADRFQPGVRFSRPGRGRDRWGRRFDGNARGSQSNQVVEKWKHDMFDEANRSPTPKNEEDHIAKIEALLAA